MKYIKNFLKIMHQKDAFFIIKKLSFLKEDNLSTKISI